MHIINLSATESCYFLKIRREIRNNSYEIGLWGKNGFVLFFIFSEGKCRCQKMFVVFALYTSDLFCVGSLAASRAESVGILQQHREYIYIFSAIKFTENAKAQIMFVLVR